MALGSVNYIRPYPDLYAAHIKEDLGITVNVQDHRILLSLTGNLVEMLQADEALQAAVRGAEVIIVWAGGEDIFQALDRGDVDCEPVIDAYGEDLNALMAEILALRDDEKTIIRLLNHYIWVKRLKQFDMFEEKGACLEAVNQQIHQVGSQYGIPVAPVWETFNGPTGQEDPGEKGYLGPDGYRLSPEGDAMVAELLRELGYDFTNP